MGSDSGYILTKEDLKQIREYNEKIMSNLGLKNREPYDILYTFYEQYGRCAIPVGSKEFKNLAKSLGMSPNKLQKKLHTLTGWGVGWTQESGKESYYIVEKGERLLTFLDLMFGTKSSDYEINWPK